MPLGATIGPAGLGVMPYTLKFEGNFFQLADFIHGLDSMVKTTNSNVAVDGRLITIDGFTLKAGPKGASRGWKRPSSVTTYVTPPEQGLTAGATPSGPADGDGDAGLDDDRRDGMKRVGPELKMPDVKVPKGVERLLPGPARPTVAAGDRPGRRRDRRCPVPARRTARKPKCRPRPRKPWPRPRAARRTRSPSRGRAVDARPPRLQEAPQGQADRSVQAAVHRPGHDQRPARRRGAKIRRRSTTPTTESESALGHRHPEPGIEPVRIEPRARRRRTWRQPGQRPPHLLRLGDQRQDHQAGRRRGAAPHSRTPRFGRASCRRPAPGPEGPGRHLHGASHEEPGEGAAARLEPGQFGLRRNQLREQARTSAS